MSNTLPPIEDSIALAAHLHRGQHDLIGEPYILHPIRVMLAMITMVERTVAVLHDVLEDTTTTPEDLLHKGYPKRIVDALIALSRGKDESYMEYVTRAAKDPVSLKVKLADLRDNMSPIRQYNLPPDKRNRLVDKYQKAIKLLQEKEIENI